MLKNFAVILGFIAMVLAPCVVALWGWMRDGEDAAWGSDEGAGRDFDRPAEAAMSAPAESTARHLAVEGLWSRSIRRMRFLLSEDGAGQGFHLGASCRL